MATFITIGYGDESGYVRTSQEITQAAHRHDDWLVARGAVMGMAGTPIQVRNHEHSGVRTQDGPFLEARLPVAGFAVLEADSAEEAVQLVAGSPCAVAFGVVEVWPLVTPGGD